MLTILITLIVVGAALYVIERLPLDGNVKTILQVFLVVVLAIYVLRFVWPMTGLG